MTDTECFKQAMCELFHGRDFLDLSRDEQRAVISRAQEIKAQTTRHDSI